MTKRFLQNTTKWVWWIAALYVGLLSPIESVNVRHPPKNPTTVEAQAKFFQDFFSVQLSPYKIEFGHVCEDPNTWEQRYESNDYKSNRAMGKVRWGDKKGGYGEHYWDLNHAGPSNNDHGYESSDDGSYNPGNSDDGSYHPDTNSDDGSYKDDETNDVFDEPSEPAPSYVNGDYDPETAANYDNNRAKRAHTRNNEKKTATERDQSKPERRIHRKIKTTETVPETDKKKTTKRRQRQKVEREYEEYQPTEKSQYNFNEDKITTTEKSRFLVNLNDEVTKTADYSRPEPRHVPYENGAGVRQHYQPETSASVLSPRLFLEASTGHIVDRATGRSYLLQPVLPPTYNN